ncbi:N-acetylglucosamine-6-phosphate deacetylase [Cryobacterium levicorallinum]|nr:amidohydrolase family protein [Cryobacterium levicorallinum]
MKGAREAIVGPVIVTNDAVVSGHAVVVREGRVEGVVPIGSLSSDLSVRDLGPGILTAGLIDIHTHGAGGKGFNDGDIEGNRVALSAYLQAGVTTVLPTLGAAPLDDMIAGIEAIDALRAQPGLPRVPGTHLEGPFFAPAQRGAQDISALRQFNTRSVDRVLSYSDAISMISYAPELGGAVAFTERLVGKGIVAAAGHSDGRDVDLWACQRAGLSHVIHVFSGQSSTVRVGPWRMPGMLEATLASDDLTVEMIADGKHLPLTLMKIAIRCLEGRLCLVSDSTPGAGMPDGSTYRMGASEFMVEDGVGVTMDRSAFGGSTTLISEMLPIAVQVQNSLPALLAMVTSIPARAARLEDVGQIAPGFHADFVLFNEDLTVQATGLAGEWFS